ncbi:orotidine-5'-phosphate decarboxylase [Paenibacillus beijingensis]|uniref:orotidine-5'-phosphate decarboxylase n=1 Tax=Paenibacillus beijingensis TaxID=1126833 RepID=UPI000695F6C0|nr:orotidine-5'-phosphate decarboxylase [Paenibacillus beijingensis]
MNNINLSFSERICEQVKLKKSHAVVGLDPDVRKIPSFIIQKAINSFGQGPEAAGNAIFQFNQLIIDTIMDFVAVVKPQLAYYEVFGSSGIDAFWRTVEYAHSKGLIVIADAKRGDISSTAEAYAQAFLKK